MRRPVIAEGLFSYQIGGSERVGVDLAIEFAHRGYQVVCFAFYDSDGPMRRELEAAGIRCLDLNYEREKGLLRRGTYQWKFFHMLRKERITALHVHHATALMLCGLPALAAGIKKVVMTEHGLYQLQERANYRRSASMYCRLASDITVVEPAQVDYFATEMYVPKGMLRFVPNGVRMVERTPQRVAQARAVLQVPNGTFAFLYVGRLSPVKDLGTLLRAFAGLPEDVRARARLYLAGDGTERAALERTTRELRLADRVMFLGARQNVRELLLAADAFVMSSTTEGLPVALLEAMATGVPCVATAVGGIPELLGNGCGLTAPARDAEALASQMTELARSDPLRRTIIENASGKVRKSYLLDEIVNRYLEILGLPPTPQCQRANS
jgi:glycosyltransferase involved in cell wall biosynthesis